MKRYKKILIALIALMSLTALAGCGRHRWHKKDNTDRILKHVDKRVNKLELNQEQNAKYQEIRTRLRADLKKMYETRRGTMTAVKAEFQKPTPDVQGLANRVKSEMENRNKTFSSFPGYFAEIYAILNDEQKQKVNKKLKHITERF